MGITIMQLEETFRIIKKLFIAEKRKWWIVLQSVVTNIGYYNRVAIEQSLAHPMSEFLEYIDCSGSVVWRIVNLEGNN